MRATDGRPYELQSVPTKTVAIRTTDNCSDLVQKLCLHRVGNGLAIPTLKFLPELKPVRRGAHCPPVFNGFLHSYRSGRRKRCISAVFYAFVLNRSSDHAGDRWSPLRVEIGSDKDRGNSHLGKLF